MSKWLPISELDTHITGRQMFVAKAFDVSPVGDLLGYRYTTDPWCVWKASESEVYEGEIAFARWPHTFPPTHFCMLPSDEER